MRRNLFVTIILAFIALVFLGWHLSGKQQEQQIETVTNSENSIKFIPLGDSYTIGLGVAEEDRWSNVLTDHLKKEGVKINLIANPAVSGYRVKDAIREELPVVQKLKPTFVTVLIGANDNFGQKDPLAYKQELEEFLNKLQLLLSDPKNIILITIPDYSKAPAASKYNNPDISQSVKEYNQVIKEEASKRGLKIVDILSVSQTMTDPKDYILDGLHPSAFGYAKWEKVIFPVVFDLLKEDTN